LTASIPHSQILQALRGGDVLAEWGPMRLVISAFVGRAPQPRMGMDAGRFAFAVLESIARARPFLSRPRKELPAGIESSPVREMVRSVLAVGDADLTPMAAVAGAIADAVADYLADRGMTKTIVNNGGDIAIRLRGEASATVGIRQDVTRHDVSHVIRLGPERLSWGVATSGMGGRSLTRGIASAASIIADRASTADAAATAVANASLVEDPEVIQVNAETVDPDTDIPGIRVTRRIGRLKEETRLKGVEQALHRAAALMERQIVLGAFVAVAGQIGMTGSFREWLTQG